MKSLLLPLLAGVLVLPVSAATIYKNVDDDGHVTYSNVPNRGAKPLTLPPISTYSSPARTPAPAAKAGGNSGSQPGFPNVDSDTQKNRDQGRRQILEQELANEQKALSDARKALEEGKAIRLGPEHKNPVKYQDRIKQLEDAVREREKNIDALQKELGRG